MTYFTLLFLHMFGMGAMCAALGVETAALVAMRSARTADEARRARWLLGPNRFIGPLALLLILGSGFPLAIRYGPAAWTWAGPTLGILVVMLALGVFSARGLGRLDQGDDAAVLSAARRGGWLLSLGMRAALLLTIVLLMVTKPS